MPAIPWSFRCTILGSLPAVCLCLACGCCSSYTLQVIDLVNDVPIEGAHASVNPTTLAGLLTLKLDTLSVAYTDASGTVTIDCVRPGSDYVNVSHSPSGRHIRVNRFTPEVMVDIMDHRLATRQAVERWISTRTRQHERRHFVIPLLSHPAFIQGVGDVANADQPLVINAVDFRGADDSAVKELSRFPNVRFLGLYGTTMTDSGLRKLGAYSRLLAIDIANCPRLTDAGIQDLRRALPDTIVVVHNRGK